MLEQFFFQMHSRRPFQQAKLLWNLPILAPPYSQMFSVLKTTDAFLSAIYLDSDSLNELKPDSFWSGFVILHWEESYAFASAHQAHAMLQ